jgi:hypothetical protein
VDLDEFIATSFQRNLTQLARTKDNDCVVIPSSVMQRADFFRCSSRGIPLATMCTTHRQSYVYPVNIRSKYFCRAKTITEPGIHFPWRTVPGSLVEEADAQDVILLHYRAEMLNKDESWVTEFRAQRFSIDFKVAKNSQKTWNEIFSNLSMQALGS